MSKIGKILLIVAFVGALVAAVGGYMLITNHTQLKVDLRDTRAQKDAAVKEVADTKVKLKDMTDAKTKADSDLADANKSVDDLKNQLATATKSAADAKDAVDKATEDAKTTQAKLDDIMAKLGGKSVDDFKADVDKAQKDAQAAESEKKIMEDQLQASKQQVVELTDALNRSHDHGKMPGVSGKVTFVDRTWNFVVLDVGLSNGVVPNGELIVYRGKNFLGKVRVTKVDPNDSVAEILPDIKGDIQVGDYVLN